MVQNCVSCQETQPSPAAAPLQTWNWPTKPWSWLHVGYAELVEGKMILIIIDAHSKWVEAFLLAIATARTTVEQVFAQLGLPDCIVSDNGPQFIATEFIL